MNVSMLQWKCIYQNRQSRSHSLLTPCLKFCLVYHQLSKLLSSTFWDFSSVNLLWTQRVARCIKERECTWRSNFFCLNTKLLLYERMSEDFWQETSNSWRTWLENIFFNVNEIVLGTLSDFLQVKKLGNSRNRGKLVCVHLCVCKYTCMCVYTPALTHCFLILWPFYQLV